MNLKGRHLLQPLDLTMEEMGYLFTEAKEIAKEPKNYLKSCENVVMASMFFEPSTRTRLSFEAAMLRLGGKVIGFSEPGSTSVAKGESIADTIRTVACYADIAVMRHPKEGSVMLASRYSDIPVINAGDGGHHHPTQTLTDLLTISFEKESFDGLTVGLCGDLKFGRTVHSLITALDRYKDIRFVLISPSELRTPDYMRSQIRSEFEETNDLREALPNLDVLYMTRVQRERFFNEEDYIRLKDTYILDSAKLKSGKSDLMVMHPLPRVNEISQEVDTDPRAFYFKQMKNGMFVRMALLKAILNDVNENTDTTEKHEIYQRR